MKTLLTLALCAASLGATTITLEGVNGDTDGSYYVAPYTLIVGGTTFNAACYDFFSPSEIGQTWEANVITLDQAAAGGKFAANPDALRKYQTVAVLFSFSTTSLQDKIDLTHAIWNVFSPGVFPSTVGMQEYAARAASLNRFIRLLEVPVH